MSRPRNRISPEVGSSRRTMQRPSVDFPQPDSPTSPSVSPAARSRETSATARTCATARSKITAAAHRKRFLQPADGQDRLAGGSPRSCAGRPRRASVGARSSASSAKWQAHQVDPAKRRVGRSTRQRASAQRAARMESAARRPVAQGRRPALDPDQRRVAGIERRQRGEQTSRVGMARVVEHVVDRAALDDPAGVHDRDRIGHAGDHAEVVGDQDQPDAEIWRAGAPAPRGSAPAP